jgi:transcription elongation GreA/GreB family factor
MAHPSAKSALKIELVKLLSDALDVARAAHAAAVEGAIADDARPENDKDTRGLEQSYLARGQATRVAELETQLAETTAMVLRSFADGDAIGISALVDADEGGRTLRYFVAPHGGGSVLAGGIQVVTLASPLGRALLGKQIDDEIELRLPGKLRTIVIVALS